MKRLTVVLMLLALPALPQSSDKDPIIADAAATVAHLHDSMLDPASFVLDNVYVTKPNKKGQISTCYVFRSHNQMGGYSEGRAVADGADHHRLSTFSQDNGYGKYPGYDVGWVAPCKDKNIDREVTAEVQALAPTLYKKTR